jgi:hypothetical protein
MCSDIDIDIDVFGEGIRTLKEILTTSFICVCVCVCVCCVLCNCAILFMLC